MQLFCRLESKFNRARFIVAGSVILMIINPSTIAIHDGSALSNHRVGLAVACSHTEMSVSFSFSEGSEGLLMGEDLN